MRKPRKPRITPEIVEAVQRLYEWCIHANATPFPPLYNPISMHLEQVLEAGRKFDYQSKMDLPPPPILMLEKLDAWNDAPDWCAPLAAASRNRLRPGDMHLSGVRAWLALSTTKPGASKAGRHEIDRSEISAWISGRTFSGFSKKEPVKVMATKIKSEIVKGGPHSCRGTTESAIVRLMRGKKPDWTKTDGKWSVKINLSQSSQ